MCPKVLWLIPGNPVTITGCAKDRTQIKFFVEAVTTAKELGIIVILEGTANSPVWTISPLAELIKDLYVTRFSWC